MNKSIKGLLVLHFLNDGVRTTFVSLLPFIAKDLSFNLSSVGFLGSSQPLFASILALPAGFLASKVGGFHFLTYLLIIYSIGALGLSLSPNLILVILTFFIAASGFGMFHTASLPMVAKVSDKTNMGANMGNFTSIGDVGRAALPPVAVFIVSLFGWRISMASIALVGFSSFLILRSLQPKKEQYDLGEKYPKETHRQFINHILSLIKTRRLFLTLLAAASDSLASSPVIIFLPFLVLSKGITVTQYGIITAAYFVGSLIGKFILGRVVDKRGNLKVFIISEILMAISLVLLTIFSQFYLVVILSVLLAIFTRGTTPVINSMMSDVVDRAHYHKIFALSEMTIGIAAVLTIILMGIIADFRGVVFVFYACALLAILATIPAFLLRKRTNDMGSE